MKGTAIVDPGKGRVYEIPLHSVREGRAMVRGPYMRDCRIILKFAARVETYERGAGGLRERRVSVEAI